jgi:demethylmenaquinone methyltransferase/2-methoxy-6-polyprenyl-1,4-benzoquinol methylase
MQRVLKPNGSLMILEFSYPKNKVVAWAYDLYFTHIMPFVGRLLSKDKTAYTYLNRSVKTFIWGEEMCARLTAAGFNHTTHKPLTFGISTIYTATN